LLARKFAWLILRHRVFDLAEQFRHRLPIPVRKEIVSGEWRAIPALKSITMTGSAPVFVDRLSTVRLRLGIDTLVDCRRLLCKNARNGQQTKHHESF
jgi:hypothetical protein